jgi:hypothetical protein
VSNLPTGLSPVLLDAAQSPANSGHCLQSFSAAFM